jgi:hypothetical protein
MVIVEAKDEASMLKRIDDFGLENCTPAISGETKRRYKKSKDRSFNI